ncbi:MAG: UDP-3-O-(3-hydroxymyristoyl)glucosamine N-acyltransferase [Ignavibacteriaceae bacterium]|nr:UDP-3-O-(3-hydroxymyristoyl)glucosamine N-acyltransferase [Ignavibacteriaceae bacterium]
MSKNLNIRLSEIAKLVGGKLIGDANVVINSVAKIDEAKKGDLTFLYLAHYEKFFASTGASAILVKPDFNKTRSDISYIEVDAPEKAFASVIINFFSPELKLSGIDKTAFIDPSSSLGKNVALGKNVVIGANCVIGNNVKIFHNTVLLDNVEVGDNSILFQNVSIREDCKIGKRVIIHPGAVIGADGFGYQKDDKGVYHKVPQIGNVVIEDDVEIGANSTIDRAAMGSTIVKKGSKIDNLVQIAHNVSVGSNTVMSAQSGVSGSVKIGNNSILAGQVGIAGHLEIGDNVILIAQSGVSKSITKPGIYFGSPAKEFRTAKILEAHIRNLPDYFERIKKLEEEIKKLKEEKFSK